MHRAGIENCARKEGVVARAFVNERAVEDTRNLTLKAAATSLSSEGCFPSSRTFFAHLFHCGTRDRMMGFSLYPLTARRLGWRSSERGLFLRLRPKTEITSCFLGCCGGKGWTGNLRDLWSGGFGLSLNRVWVMNARKRQGRVDMGEFITIATQAEPCPFFDIMLHVLLLHKHRGRHY
jgi:hypothetical protein